MIDVFLSLAMLAAGALILGGITLLRRGDRRKGGLMLATAAVLIGNVVILAAPL